jgi:hypothetical protein
MSSHVLGTGELRDDLAKGAGCAINLAIAEYAVQRRAPIRPRPVVALS